MKPIYGSENYFFVACTWPLILDSKSFFSTSALFKEPGEKTWDVFQLLSFVHNHHKPIQANKLNAKTQLFLLLWQPERGWCTDAELKYHRRKNNSLSLSIYWIIDSLIFYWTDQSDFLDLRHHISWTFQCCFCNFET